MYVPDLGDPVILAVYGAAGLVFVSVCFGGRPERLGFVILAIMLALQLALHSWLGGPTFEAVEVSVLVADLFGFAAFVALMRQSERLWPIFAVIMMMMSLLGHFARATGDMLPLSYANFEAGPTVLILATLPFAVVLHQVRARRRGFDRDFVPLRSDRAIREAFRKHAK